MSADEEAKIFEDMMAHREDIFRICLGFSRNASDAEDLSQEVYLKAYRGLGRIHTPYAVKEWLLRIARTTCLDHLKKRRLVRLFERSSGREAALTADTPESAAVAKESLALLKTAVAGLPRRQREVFILREYGNLSYEEIARTVGIRLGTVMSRLNRARTAVASQVREAGHGKEAR
jgi:RNA polymerase sigma-70 factor (ECF subfamily)